MQESKRKQYAHLYEGGTYRDMADSPKIYERTPGGMNRYLRDAEEIKHICAHNDLGDTAANGKLYDHLRQEKCFSSWVGEAFLSGLMGRTGKNRRRQTIEKVCKRIAVSFLAMAVVLLLVLLYFQIKEAEKSAVLDYIRQEKAQLEKAEAEKDEISILDKPEVAILSQYAIIYSMYPDLVGWLTVEGCGIDDPVMQDISGQEFYLKHNFEGREDSKGSLFVDADSCIWPLDKNIVIYGHNVNAGTQFGNLDYYLDPAFYEQHPTFTYDTIYERGTYQIVAVVKTHVRQGDESGFRYYWLRNYQNRGEFQELLDFISENRIYDTGEYLSYGDTTVMLSTCEYTVENGRLVIIAKKVEE